MSRLVIMPSILSQISTLKDGSMKIVLETYELPAETMLAILQARGKASYVAIKPEDFTVDEEVSIEALDMPNFNGKSLSQQLRMAMYKYWRNVNDCGYSDFEEFRRSQMQVLINKYSPL